MDLKIGDVVQLKSGGPLMTVEDVKGLEPNRLAVLTEESDFKPTVKCVWFTGNGELEENYFITIVLSRYAGECPSLECPMK